MVDSKDDAIAEVENLPRLDFKVFISPDPVIPEATDCRQASKALPRVGVASQTAS
jgi:hypothetical protein